MGAPRPGVVLAEARQVDGDRAVALLHRRQAHGEHQRDVVLEGGRLVRDERARRLAPDPVDERGVVGTVRGERQPVGREDARTRVDRLAVAQLARRLGVPRDVEQDAHALLVRLQAERDERGLDRLLVVLPEVEARGVVERHALDVVLVSDPRQRDHRAAHELGAGRLVQARLQRGHDLVEDLARAGTEAETADVAVAAGDGAQACDERA
jgi:hypothetical protein